MSQGRGTAERLVKRRENAAIRGNTFRIPRYHFCGSTYEPGCDISGPPCHQVSYDLPSLIEVLEEVTTCKAIASGTLKLHPLSAASNITTCRVSTSHCTKASQSIIYVYCTSQCFPSPNYLDRRILADPSTFAGPSTTALTLFSKASIIFSATLGAAVAPSIPYTGFAN